MKKKQPAGCCRLKHLKNCLPLSLNGRKGLRLKTHQWSTNAFSLLSTTVRAFKKSASSFAIACIIFKHIFLDHACHHFSCESRTCFIASFAWSRTWNTWHGTLSSTPYHPMPKMCKNHLVKVNMGAHNTAENNGSKLAVCLGQLFFFVWLATEEPSTGCNCCILMFSSRTNWRQKSPPKCQSQHQIHCVKKFFLPAASSNNFCNFLAWASGHMPRTSATYPASPFSVVTTSLEGQASWRSSRSNSKVSGSWPETAMRTASLKSQNNKTTRPRTLWRLCGFCKPNAKSIVTQYTTYK